ncbi:hypothetical protein AXK56_18240 [Tsukamurella pulmonis]|uniref:Uncharacterized protein n=1 Tax=Tsukamurella pulmonis TaxID=47312 RepID=A0A1H1HMT1_9ACTN|nr:hypothetical protein [Tsukamurella pulmonis]KXO94580.1 hypothetical protein AXK56_18240 [Tsukamurella pulmonis]SDR26376.1 hypothetical protein SAMN04489765_4349 [Tsukamurella pulmonis]SUP14055.1 Uncharacterised protein [Tsukamurella pulmonis]
MTDEVHRINNAIKAVTARAAAAQQAVDAVIAQYAGDPLGLAEALGTAEIAAANARITAGVAELESLVGQLADAQIAVVAAVRAADNPDTAR